MSDLKAFIEDESGATTVDFVVLTGALVGLGISTVPLVSAGAGGLAQDVSAFLTGGDAPETPEGTPEELAEIDEAQAASDLWGASNRVTNGSFEELQGLYDAGWGYWSPDGRIQGWDTFTERGPEVTPSGWNGITATDGDFMLDLDASPGNVTIGQTIPDAVDGERFSLTFDAADAIGNNGMEVYWGGELVQAITPTGSMTGYSFELVAGAGDGSNTILLAGTGPEDQQGTYIDNVSVNRLEENE